MPLSSNDMDADADQTYIWGTNLSGAARGRVATCIAGLHPVARMKRAGLLTRDIPTCLLGSCTTLGATPLCECCLPGLPPAVSRVQARFNAFVRTFKENGADEEAKYMQLLQEVGSSCWSRGTAIVCQDEADRGGCVH